MRTILTSLCLLGILNLAIPTQGAEKNKVKSIPFKVVENYFVLNTIQPAEGLNWKTGIAKTQEEFDSVFGIARVMGEQEFLPENHFEKKAVVYFILWGNTPWEFSVQSVLKEGNTLIIRYDRKGTPSESAQYAVPLILSVDKAVVESNPEVFMKQKGSQPRRR